MHTECNVNLQVGSSFNIELEVRPRSKTGVLLSVGVLEYLTLHFMNGSVTFSVDNGAGPESVSFIPVMSNALCDGHWHHIKVSAQSLAIDTAVLRKVIGYTYVSMSSSHCNWKCVVVHPLCLTVV